MENSIADLIILQLLGRNAQALRFLEKLLGGEFVEKDQLRRVCPPDFVRSGNGKGWIGHFSDESARFPTVSCNCRNRASGRELE